MKRPRRSPTRKSEPSKTAYRPTPAEVAIEEIRDRRRRIWKDLGSYEAVAAVGRRIRAERLSAKRPRKRAA
ncbi:MAG TPA: hypothetical protein PKE29_03385 [Phycisphaerales bacterium]|nr:hypothetical protein [Phycisphaerales bacterium]